MGGGIGQRDRVPSFTTWCTNNTPPFISTREGEREYSIVYVIKSVSIYTYLKLLKQGFLYGDDVCVCIYIER